MLQKLTDWFNRITGRSASVQDFTLFVLVAVGVLILLAILL